MTIVFIYLDEKDRVVAVNMRVKHDEINSRLVEELFVTAIFMPLLGIEYLCSYQSIYGCKMANWQRKLLVNKCADREAEKWVLSILGRNAHKRKKRYLLLSIIIN